jgi:transcriptional regulator with XRE-family HTH domain
MRRWKRIVGSNVRDLRKARGLTQEDVALEADINLKYVGGIERGQRNPSLLILVKIAKVLGVQPADLLKRR